MYICVCVYIYIYIYIFAHISPLFLDFLPIQVTTEHKVEFPVLYNSLSLVTYFIHRSVYMSVPISQFILPTYPLWCLYVCSLHLCLYLYFANWFICTIFLDCTYMYVYSTLNEHLGRSDPRTTYA